MSKTTKEQRIKALRDIAAIMKEHGIDIILKGGGIAVEFDDWHVVEFKTDYVSAVNVDNVINGLLK